MERCKQRAAVSVLLLALCLVGPVSSAYADANALEVRYTGAEDTQVVAGSELFAHVENGLPGDVFVGSMSIVNESDDACEVFVRLQNVVAEGPDDMLDRIPFTLEAAGETVFQGVLSDTEGAEPISLGFVEAGDAVDVECAAVIPSELTSEYADATVGMNVAVGMRAHGEENPLVATGAPLQSASQGAALVQAGDKASAAPLVLLVAAATGTVIWFAWKRRMRIR